MRDSITLVCTDCKNRNYRTTKRKAQDVKKLEINKFCKFCRARTLHKEQKK